MKHKMNLNSDPFKCIKDRTKTIEICFEESRGYIQLIMNDEEKNTYKELIFKLKNNNNYYVKYMVNKYL